MAKLTVSPDTNPETTSVDGTLRRLLVDEDWVTIHDGAVGTDVADADGETSLSLNTSGTTNHWAEISRIFLLFDTSAIPAGAQIISAVLRVWFLNNANSDGLGLDPSAAIYSSNPASNTALVLADYNKVGTVRMSNKIARSSLAVPAYNDFTLNARGLEQITPGGISKFSLRWDNDAENREPTWASSQIVDMDVLLSDDVTGAHDPQLVVTYGTLHNGTTLASPSSSVGGTAANNGATGITATTGAGAWAASAFTTDVWVDGWPFDVALESLTFEWPASIGLADVTIETVFNIYTGAVGSEVLIAQLPWCQRRDTGAGYHLSRSEIWLPEPMKIPANTRISIRVLHSNTTATTYEGIKLRFHELPMPIVISPPPASFTASNGTKAAIAPQSPASLVTMSSVQTIATGSSNINVQSVAALFTASSVQTVAESLTQPAALVTASRVVSVMESVNSPAPAVTMNGQPSTIAESVVSVGTVTMSRVITVGEIVNSPASLFTASSVSTPAFAPTAKGTVTMSSVISAAEIVSPPPSTATFSSIVDFTSGGGGAPVFAKEGSFAAPAGTGNLSVTGLGGAPKLVLFWANLRTADGVSSTVSGSSANMPMCILGFGISNTLMGCIGDSDDFSSGDPFLDATKCIRINAGNSGAATDKITAAFVSCDSDGFTVNFTTTITGVVINYLAIGGSTFDVGVASATISGTGHVALTGSSIQPDAAIIIGGGAVPPGFGVGHAGLGFVSGLTQRVAMSSTYGNSTVNQYQRTNKAYVEAFNNAVEVEADIFSLDSGGLTLDVTTFDGAVFSTTGVRAICMKGIQFHVGSFNMRTDATSALPVTGVGFSPKALLVASGEHPSSAALQNPTGPEAGVNWMIGGMTGSTARGVVTKSSGNNGNEGLDRTKVVKTIDTNNPATVTSAADWSSWDSDGFTLNQSIHDATAREILYMVFGDQAGGGGGAITITQPPGSHTMSAISTAVESLASPPPLVTFSNPSTPAFTPSAKGSFTAGVGSVSAAESLTAPVASLTASGSQTAAEALTQPPGTVTPSSGMSPSFTPTGKGTFTASVGTMSGSMSAQTQAARVDFSAVSTVPGIALAIQDVPASFTANRGAQSAAESLNSPAGLVTMNASQTAAESAVSQATVTMQSVTTISWTLSKFASSTFSSAGGTLAEAAVPNSATVTFSRVVTTEQAIHVPAGSMTLSAVQRAADSLTSPAARVTFNTGAANFTYLLTSLRHYIMRVGSPSTRILSTKDQTEITSATPEKTRLRRVEGNG